MEIWLSTTDRKEIFRFPYINPENIQFGTKLNIENFNTSTGNTLTLVGKEGLKEIKIHSFFPHKLYRWLPFNVFLAPDCIKFIKGHLEEVLLLTVVSIENTFVMSCCISNFEYYKKINGDIEFDMTLLEYRAKSKAKGG
ncbi:MAG: hypothetical protein SOR81_01105 [Fusobacterium sp.]|uniref:hypothetical protein n=1 Tax=Fusobacterium sp. TaxID=68766 RepID=UPI002A74A08F|nr:hypothetical protein [Fusobacterium sp.]MDY2980197.1 hypothetical protein [Fusobacterium sp.]